MARWAIHKFCWVCCSTNNATLGYELYSGDTYEGHTLADSIKKLKTRYKIDKVVVVADSGMMNTDNLSEIKDSGYEFIVGERLKNLPQATQNYLLDLTNYSVMNIPISGENEETISLKYRITTYKNRKILCTYSEKRAKKDRFEREKRIEKAKMLMKNTAQLGKKAAVYYLKSNIVDTQTGEVTDTKQSKSNKIYYQLDEEKIAQAAKYDGLKAIATSDHELSNEDILLKYRDLYQIEQIFRTFKTFLETRPMFHWTDERIKGHFCICYLSFCLLNYLQKLLKQHNQNHSENDIRRILNKMQITHLQQDGQDYYLRASLDQNTNNLLKIIKMKPLPDLSANPPKINYSTKM
jgi:transposase